MPYNLLLFPLLGGFLFLHVNHFFRFHAQRMDGYRLLVESAIAGSVLGMLARGIVVFFDGSQLGKWTASVWDPLAPWPDSNMAALSMVLGPVLALVVNLFVDKQKAKDLEVERHANSLTSFLHDAERSESIISITLD